MTMLDVATLLGGGWDVTASAQAFRQAEVRARTKRANALACRRRGSAIRNSVRRTSPRDAHPIRGTSTTSQAGLKPTGTLRSHRFDTPRWRTSRLRQWAADQLTFGSHMQENASPYEFLPTVVIARQPERMVKEVSGHGGSSSWFSLA
jgi:hypothetical protein